MTSSRLDTVRRWVGASKNWLSAFLEAAPYDPALVAVVVMGSAVRERGHRRSDLDLLVVYRGKRPAIKSPLEIDVRLHSIDRVEEQLATGHEVLCWAVKFGTAVYDPVGFWEHLQQSWRQRVPLPSVHEARRRATQALVQAKEMLRVQDESAADDLILAALTQLVRERLLENGIFPASRPELPDQLRFVAPCNPFAQLLEDAMYGDSTPSDLMKRIDIEMPRCPPTPDLVAC